MQSLNMVSVSLADAIRFHRNSEKRGKARQRGDCDLEINLKFTKVYTFTFLTLWVALVPSQMVDRIV